MRNLLALIGLAVVLFGGLGWYLGWYKLGVESSDPSHPRFNVEVEADKIKGDLQKGAKKVSGILDKEVQGLPTSLPINPGVIPPPSILPPPPANVNTGDVVNPVTIPLPPPPSFNPNR